MNNSSISINFILEGTKPNKDGKFPIKLNVYQKEAGQKRYGIKEFVTKEEWEKLDSAKLRDSDLKNLKARLNALASKVSKITDKIQPFSFVAFEEAYFSRTVSGDNNTRLDYKFEKYIKALKASGQIGTAISYQTTINSINTFKKRLTIYDVTTDFLQEYENYLLAENKSVSTVGIYMRQLRAIINQAIKDKALSADKYPFKEYTIPSGRNIKKALAKEDLQRLLEYHPEEPNQAKALDFWMLSYLCNGMNFTDIAHLKPENISGKYLSFIREKTKRTKKKDLRPIKVGLNPRAIEIIKKHLNKEKDNPYLFPILDAGLSAVTVKHRCQRFVKWVNRYMDKIAKDLGIEQKVRTYEARHSFSTVLKRKGAPTSFIKEALGHSSEITTENYLDSFTDDVKLDYANSLTDL